MKNLKKLALITFVVLTGFACSDDDDNDSTTSQNQASIIGTWKWVASTQNGENQPLDECELLFTLVFNTSQVTETDFYGDNCEMTETDIASYSIDGNSITVNYDGESFTSEITTLNNSTLTVKDTEDGIVFTETYTKQ